MIIRHISSIYLFSIINSTLASLFLHHLFLIGSTFGINPTNFKRLRICSATLSKHIIIFIFLIFFRICILPQTWTFFSLVVIFLCNFYCLVSLKHIIGHCSLILSLCVQNTISKIFKRCINRIWITHRYMIYSKKGMSITKLFFKFLLFFCVFIKLLIHMIYKQ